MAKQLTAQPLLSTLIEQIQALSPTPIDKKDIARDLLVEPQTLSRMLNKEENGKAVPAKVIRRLQLKYKHLLRPYEIKVDENKMFSWLAIEVMELRAVKTLYLSLLKDTMSDEQYTAAIASVDADKAQQLAQWRETGTF